MSIKYLKQGKTDAAKAIDDAEVSKIVKSTLKAIEARGDEAVREFSEKFDNYTPKSFKLSPAEIDSLVKKVSPQDLEDIKFKYDQLYAQTALKLTELEASSNTSQDVNYEQNRNNMYDG